MRIMLLVLFTLFGTSPSAFAQEKEKTVGMTEKEFTIFLKAYELYLYDNNREIHLSGPICKDTNGNEFRMELAVGAGYHDRIGIKLYKLGHSETFSYMVGYTAEEAAHYFFNGIMPAAKAAAKASVTFELVEDVGKQPVPPVKKPMTQYGPTPVGYAPSPNHKWLPNAECGYSWTDESSKIGGSGPYSYSNCPAQRCYDCNCANRGATCPSGCVAQPSGTTFSSGTTFYPPATVSPCQTGNCPNGKCTSPTPTLWVR